MGLRPKRSQKSEQSSWQFESRLHRSLDPRYGMSTASVFWRRDRLLKSSTDQPSQTRRNKLSTNPVVCGSAMPNNTFIVRQA